MFFQTLSGTSLVENCDSRLNPNVSSLPIRISIYFQCLFAILLALGRTSSREITLSNFLLQASSLSVMAAAFISSDISQAIIASHFSVMLSMCRNTPFDFGREFLQSRPGLKTVTRILLLDVVFRPISLCFNYRLWKRVRNLQMTGSSCESAVKWVFFGKRLEIDMSGTTVAFTLAIFDIGWELTRVVGEILRIWTLCENEEVTIARQIGFDSRMWWIKQVYIKARRVFTAEMEYDGWDWDFICRWTRRISQLQKSVICGYVIWTVETMVDINGPIVDEVRWTFWPLFAIGNMLGMFSMFAIRYLTFIPFRGIKPSSTVDVRNYSCYCSLRSLNLFCNLFYRLSHNYGHAPLLSWGIYQLETGSRTF